MRTIKYYYETPIVAIKKLRENGFSVDFNLQENCLVCHLGSFDESQFEITEVYFYEGESDPSEEATVYGIESSTGVKGILVTGQERDEDEITTAIIQKLLVSRQQNKP